MISLEYIYRYPIKGFPGERLEDARLNLAEGIVGDRKIGVGSGAMAVNQSGEWTPCQAFQRMTIRPDLTTFQVDRHDHILTLTAPSGRSETIDADTKQVEAGNPTVGDQLPVYRANGNKGYWDHPDAALSIINLSTVDAISQVIGQTIDPLRFRANIYIRAKPWSEFQWLGSQLSLGEAELDVIRPIDRCKTTSVNVKTGVADLNMPALLVRHFGHLYCGVYASVKKSGTIVPGASVKITGKSEDRIIEAAANAITAPALPDWPRPMRVSRTVEEATDIRSIWLEDPLAKTGSLSNFKAGQYIRIHNLAQTHTWRSYTVSAVDGSRLRITVKRDAGVGSQAMHSFNVGDNLTVSGPFGEATLSGKSKAHHFLTAGIGITPTVAKLRYLYAQGFVGKVRVTHVARTASELALWDDVVDAAKRLSGSSLELHLTKNVGDTVGAKLGRPDPSKLAEYAKSDKADVHICGPTTFVNSVMAALGSIDFDEEKIFLDTFSSPSVETEMRPIPASEPIRVTLQKSDITENWTPADGTLLDFAEARGVVISSNCRAGLCKSCSCKILSGSATRLVGEEGNDRRQTLVCSSIPSESIILEV
nr:MOSC domain-containing protein [Maritalea porphyrae]